MFWSSTSNSKNFELFEMRALQNMLSNDLMFMSNFKCTVLNSKE